MVGLLGELSSQMEKEKKASGSGKKDQVLYNQFVQDGIEFMMLLLVPTERRKTISSYKDLIPS